MSILPFAFATWLVSVSGWANSQPAALPSPSERSEPHEALAFYEGTWTILDSKHEGYRETCSWLAGGRRHIVCRASVQTASGTRETLGTYSYDPTSGEYLGAFLRRKRTCRHRKRPTHSERVCLQVRAWRRRRQGSGSFHDRGGGTGPRQHGHGNCHGRSALGRRGEARIPAHTPVACSVLNCALREDAKCHGTCAPRGPAPRRR